MIHVVLITILYIIDPYLFCHVTIHWYGFRKNHSTYMALLHLIDKVTSALSKAFDTVDHHILLEKLHKRDIMMLRTND